MVAETASPPSSGSDATERQPSVAQKAGTRGARKTRPLPNVGNMGAGGALKVVFAATSAKVPEAQRLRST